MKFCFIKSCPIHIIVVSLHRENYTKLVRTKDIEISMSTIEELQKLSEREDHVEFKKAEHNYPFAGCKPW